MLDHLCSLVLRRRRRVFAAWAAVFVLGLVAAGGLFSSLDADLDGAPRLESERVGRRLDQLDPGGGEVVAIVDGAAVDPAVLDGLRGIDGVTDVQQGPSDDGRATGIVVSLTADLGDDRHDALVADVADRLRAIDAPEVLVGGELLLDEEVADVAEHDAQRAESIALPLTLVVMAIVFGGLLAAGLPLAIALCGVTGTALALTVADAVTDVSLYAVNVTIMLGLGLGIDYGLLMVNRFREEGRTATAVTPGTAGDLPGGLALGNLADGPRLDPSAVAVPSTTDVGASGAAGRAGVAVALPESGLATGRPGGVAHPGVDEAVRRTVATAGRTVVFSASTVAVALGALLVFDDPTIRSLGLAGIAVVVTSMAAALTLLPALLGAFGHRLRVPPAPLPGPSPADRTELGPTEPNPLGTPAATTPVTASPVTRPTNPSLVTANRAGNTGRTGPAGAMSAAIRKPSGAPAYRGDRGDRSAPIAPGGQSHHGDEGDRGDQGVPAAPGSRQDQGVPVGLQGDQGDHGWFARLARVVQRRPAVVAVVVSVGLAVLALPFLGARFDDPGVKALPRSSETRAVAEAVDQRFSSVTAEPVEVVADVDPSDPAVAPWVAAVGDLAGVRSAEVSEISQPGTTVVEVHAAGPSNGSTAQRVVTEVRALDAPFPVLVGGDPAEIVDFRESIVRRLPLAIGVVVAATFVLLFLMTGSVLVPLKAIVMNVLSLGATFGALVWIFQDGHLSGLLGFDPPGSLDFVMPVIIFVFGFGLSMDYEVFLLARIREVWLETGDSDRAVAVGLQRSGRIITSAALLIVIVFAGFAAGEIVPLKELGLGLALAVVVDATVVRILLVPATMTLLGRRNWWAPRPLARLHRRLALREA